MKSKKINKESGDLFSNFRKQKKIISEQLEKRKSVIDKYLLLT